MKKFISITGMVFIKPNKYVIMMAVVCSLFSCKKQTNEEPFSWEESRKHGFVLKEYKISNKKLDSITIEFVKWQKRANDELDKDIQLMYVLARPDSMKCVIEQSTKNNHKEYIDVLAFPHNTQFIGFCSSDKNEMTFTHIFRNSGEQIFGYVACEGLDIVLLTNISERYYFERLFSGLFHATGHKKRFKDLYYPESISWGCYNPTYLVYKMKDGEISIPIWAGGDIMRAIIAKEDSTWKWN